MNTREELLSRKRSLELGLEIINEELKGFPEIPEISEVGAFVLENIKKRNEEEKNYKEQLLRS